MDRTVRPPALPDEPPDDGRTIRWTTGALDGVVTRHGDAAEETERGAQLAGLIRHAADGDPHARDALHAAARGDGIVFALDPRAAGARRGWRRRPAGR